MKEFEVSIYTKKNSYYIPDRFICGYVIAAEDKKQAREFAWELLVESGNNQFLPRGCFRMEVERA